MSIYGTIVTGADVEAAFESHIKAWQADYLGEVAAQAGMARSKLPRFRSYPRMIDMAKWNDSQTPACIIAAPGTRSVTQARGRRIQATWDVGIGVIVSARDENETLRLAQLYAAAVRSLVMQHPGISGFATGTTLISERYDGIFAADETRTLASGILQFGVDVDSIVDMSQGPSAPLADPNADPGDWPTVATVGIQVQKES